MYLYVFFIEPFQNWSNNKINQLDISQANNKVHLKTIFQFLSKKRETLKNLSDALTFMKEQQIQGLKK